MTLKITVQCRTHDGHHFPESTSSTAWGGEEEDEEVATRQAAEPATALPASLSRAAKHRQKGGGAVKPRTGLFRSLTADSHPRGPVEDSQNDVACWDRAEQPGFFTTK